ncbi:MAG: hypothetical protein GY847_11215 [Proteobacteria bacterium]|nr:hypothetical protein [Pseudomonadota bacterium]
MEIRSAFWMIPLGGGAVAAMIWQLIRRTARARLEAGAPSAICPLAFSATLWARGSFPRARATGCARYGLPYGSGKGLRAARFQAGSTQNATARIGVIE